MVTLATIISTLVIVSVIGVNGKLSLGEDGKPIVIKQTISTICAGQTLPYFAKVDSPRCLRYPVPKEKKGVQYVSFSADESSVELVSAEEGGFYIRVCSGNDGEGCLYWQDAGNKNEWEYLRLSKEPISRWQFASAGRVHHFYDKPIYRTASVTMEAYEGTVYKIESLDSTTAYKHLSTKRKLSDWLITGDTPNLWLVKPGFEKSQC